MGSKTCSKCGIEFSYDQYYVYRVKGKEHLYSWCKSCHYKKTKVIRKKWMKDNLEKGRKLVYDAMNRWKEQDDKGVYLIQTDKGCYVGSSNSITQRIRQHKSPSQPGPLKSYQAKYISHTILEIVEERDKRLEREKYWTRLIQPKLNKRNK